MYLGSASSGAEVGRLLKAAVDKVVVFKGRIPRTLAICGRSNVGKSSLVNALLGIVDREKARTSKFPGRTQKAQLFGFEKNYVEVGNKYSSSLVIVDLPGYGFAKVPQQVMKEMSTVINSCAVSIQDPVLANAHIGTLILIDSRRGISPDTDLPMMHAISKSEDINGRRGKFQIVLTKSDAVSEEGLEQIAQDTINILQKEFSASSLIFPDKILSTSSKKKLGVTELRKAIFSLL